jgi:hypothetical protein
MKIKEGFVVRKVMGNNVVIATGAASKNFHGMVKLNDTAAEIWGYISEGLSTDVIFEKMLEKYEVEESLLRQDIDKTVSALAEQGFIEL